MSDASEGKRSGLAYARGDNIGHPYTGCDCHGNLILIPNDEARVSMSIRFGKYGPCCKVRGTLTYE
jgi:hypothetical protein